MLSVQCLAVNAQRPSGAVWLALSVPVKLNTKWQWHNDAGYRTLGLHSYAQQYLYRTGGRFQFSKTSTAAAGVAFFFTRTSFSKTNHEFGKEFRTWQELQYEQKTLSKISFEGRMRTEQRFFQSTRTKELYTAHRFRLRAGIVYTITAKWAMQLSEEYMQQLAHSEFRFDQSRILLTATHHFNSTANVRAGYMWLLWPAASSQHIFTVSFQKQISLHGTAKS